MRPSSLALWLLCSMPAATALAAPARAPAKKPADPAPPPPPTQNANDCAVAKGVARYVGYGYTHVIALVNGCSQAVECEVWTDVDAEHTTVSVGPGDTSEVVTRRGSPAREVTAFKQCTFK